MKERNNRRSRNRTRLYILLSLAGLLILLSILAPLLTPNDPNATSARSRVLMGARTSIFSAVTLVAVTFVFGTVLGMLAGWFGGAADTAVMRLADVFLAFPQMVLAIAVAGVLGGGMFNAMLAMGVTGWTLYARLARAQVLALKKEAYVSAARLTGQGALPILLKTLLPNMLGPLAVNASTQIGTMMIGIAGLSFLGIGVTEPQAEWGSMISGARAYIQLAPWAVLAPAAATILTVMIFNCLGDCLRDVLDVEGAR